MYSVSNEEFEGIIKSALRKIPKEFLDKLDNVNITFQDLPSEHQILKMGGNKNYYPVLLGLYEGVPRTKRLNYGVGGTLPDRITLFKKPIEFISQDKNHLVQIIIRTLEHEVAHYFGMDEEAVRKAQG